jgi:Protein of unknown function (DUF1566)
MNALARDIRKLLADRIQSASAADLFAIATSICANDDPRAATAAPPAVSSRFTRYDLHGAVVPSGGVAVYDAETNLTWTIAPLECGSVPWKDALQACSNYRLFGKDDWRAPTVKERVSIIDYAKVGPALYSEFSAADASYEWTSTPDAESPSDCAWVVSLRGGGVGRYNQADHSSVRAVRAGQPLSLGI